MKRTMLAACAASIVALLAFLSVHAVLIVPIWWSALRGLPFVLVPSIAMAPAFHLLVRKWWQGIVFGVALWICIAPPSLLKNVFYDNDVVFYTLSSLTGALLAFAFRRDWRSALAGALAGGAMLIASAGPLSIFRSARALHLFFALLPICALYGLAIAVIAFSSSAESRLRLSTSAR